MGAWISMISSVLSRCNSSGNSSENVPQPFIALANWTGHRIDISPCKCSTDPMTKANLAEMDPLIAAGYHNLTCSPLCRLPEELLLDMMERLDLLSIQCLRRVSRLFLRLYCSSAFRNTHCPEPERPSDLHWHWYRTKIETLPSQLRHVLDKDIMEYCGDCQRRRNEKSWKEKLTTLTEDYLHCSGCNIDHPICIFSKAQRLKPPTNRICIGREGYLPICGHYKVTWNDVIKTGLELARLNTREATVGLNSCGNISHAPKHSNCKAITEFNYDAFPRVEVRGCRSTSIYIDSIWTGHLNLSETGFDELGYNEVATPNLIRQELQKFRLGVAEYLAPEFPPGRLLEMNCFDPNRCSCLHYTGVEQLPYSWQLTPPQDYFRACRRDPKHNGLRPLRPFQNIEQKSPQVQQVQARIESHIVGVQTTGIVSHGSSWIMIAIEPCSTDSRCLKIHYSRSTNLIPEWHRVDCVSWAWCQMLDPDSYNILDDEKALGVLWCPQKGCRNYYRYIRKAPFPLASMNRECEASCPLK